jgi:hypothetical protein
MEELALTAHRLLSVWWLILWRGSIGGWILGFVAGGIAGFIMGATGHPELAAVAGAYAGLALMPFWGLLIVHMALKKRYKDFQIGLLPR